MDELPETRSGLIDSIQTIEHVMNTSINEVCAFPMRNKRKAKKNNRQFI